MKKQEKKETPRPSGVVYVVAPDGSIHFVTSPKDVAEIAEAYRDYIKR